MSTTKRITKRLLAVVLTVMMLMSMVTIGITSASAAKVELAPTGYDFAANTKVYFDLSGLNWPSNYKVEIMLGHSTWSATYEMTKVANTDLYYVNLPFWGGATEFCVIANSSAWGDEGNSPSHRRGYASYKTAIYTMSGNFSGVFTLYPNSGNTTLTPEYKGTTYDAVNAAQNVAVQSNISGAYAADTAAAKVAINTYKLTNVSTASASTASGATATASAARGANVTLSYSDVAEGYTFVGWYEGDTQLSTDATYTYNYDGGATNDYTARFEYTATEEESSSVVASSSTGEVESQPTTTTPGTSDPEETNGTAMDASAWFTANGLYAYASVATGDEIGADAWQRWDNVSGHSANRYIYLPASASDTEVVIYNNYSDYVVLNGVKIDAGCYAIVPYVNGTTYTTSGATTQTVKIMKSDAEGTLFINSADGMTTKNDAGTKSTVDAEYDLYTFMTSGSKNQEAAWAAGAVADADGVDEIANTVKKIKGRGNSTWNLAKKPFNITYDTKISVDGMAGKKWSLLANAQDPSLLRNRLVYDLANEVNMTYACDSRFVDWFVNGDYKGSYQLTQKIEMGKNTVMPDLEEPEVEDVIDEDTGELIPYPKADFDFILELDTAENAANAGDMTFTTTRGQVMTHKTPDEPATEQVAFMKAKYQAVEDALYTGDIATLEKLVDLDDFARAYLINEVAKNLDAGVTSCYFTYNSETGMFTTAPVWDYDNALGNSVSIAGRHDASGKMLDVTGPSGWYARDLMHYDLNVLNVFGQACATTSKNAAGETFNDVVKRIWNDEFMPALAVLEGTATAAEGRLGTVAGYMANLKNSGKWNYDYAGWALTANNGWVADHSSLVMYDYDADANTYTTSNKTYDQYTLDGQANYAGDWLVSRMNWMAAQYAAADVEVPDGYITIYFENNWQWPDAKVYYWGSTIGTNPEWKGISLTNVVGQNDQGYDIYEIVIPEDITGLLFNGTGEYGAEQSADITSGWYEGICYYMTYDSATNTKPCGSYDYKVPEETTSATAETDPSEGTTASKPASGDQDATESTPSEATTVTVYVVNSVNWDKVQAYAWTTDPAVAWPGEEMTLKGVYGTFNVYEISFDEAYANIIFNNKVGDTGAQTADLELMDGYYYDLKTAKWYENLEDVPAENPLATNNYLAGSFNSWSEIANEFMLKEADGTVGYVTLTLEAETTYEFKVIRAGAWTSCTTPVTGTVAGLQFSSSNKDNCTITTTDAGEYVFAFGLDNSQLSVTYPGDVTPEPPVPDTTVKLAGDFTDWGTNAIEMTADENGTVYTTEQYFAAGTYKFKMIEFGKWLGNNGSIENTCEGWTFRNGTDDNGNEYGNCTLVATGGTYTFTFDTATDKLTVTAVLDPIVTPVYDVTWNESENFTVNAPATIDEAATLTFTVDAAEDYVIAAVIYNMTKLEAVDGVYTIENVQGDVELLIVEAEKTGDDTGTETPDIPVVYQEFPVMFVDYDNSIIATQMVKNGELAVAPDAPERTGYTFTGWSEDLTVPVTKALLVVAQYSKIIVPVEPATIGTLQIDVTGGTGFTLTINDVTRPQGTTYLNKKAPIDATVTVVANSTNGNEFLGWINTAGAVVSTSEEYTFVTSGNDILKAVYRTSIDDVSFVVFKNAEAAQNRGQYLDMQYYVSGDKVVYPDDARRSGYDFVGWKFAEDKTDTEITDEMIQAKLAAGEDMTIVAMWKRMETGYNITVNNGKLTGSKNSAGEYIYNTTAIATANAPESGMKFAYWVDENNIIKSYDAEYTFFVYYAQELTAVYVASDKEITYEPILEMFADPNVEGEYIKYIATWDIDESIGKVTNSGLLLVNANDYNESTFYHGSGDSKLILDRSFGAADAVNTGSKIISKNNSYVGNTYIATFWIVYTDANGQTQTIHADPVTVEKLTTVVQ